MNAILGKSMQADMHVLALAVNASGQTIPVSVSLFWAGQANLTLQHGAQVVVCGCVWLSRCSCVTFVSFLHHLAYSDAACSHLWSGPSYDGRWLADITGKGLAANTDSGISCK